ncbi:YcgN family cysteine cluster protein [Sphingomonas bacterium]|uniref:YcgN family cysteine cluster protein n=1 Tax=Sphingomonas bacterium TaxID=1895847 RepID=UPI00157577CC|nr:YcgN family cysteine cluster protein [Sphingomonas bacterium]
MSRFWEERPLSALTRPEWESLCDGCGKCCLHKLEDEETGEVFPTNVACRLLDRHTARCKDYRNRRRFVPDCVRLTPAKLDTLDWLPTTCAYRLVAAGEPLPEWHPLVSGDPESVHAAGISTRGWTVSEDEAGELEYHLVDRIL